MSMHDRGASVHTYDLGCVGWRSLLGVFTRMEIHVSMCSLVRWHYTCVCIHTMRTSQPAKGVALDAKESHAFSSS